MILNVFRPQLLLPESACSLRFGLPGLWLAQRDLQSTFLLQVLLSDQGHINGAEQTSYFSL